MIQIQGLHRWFGTQHVLQGVDLTIQDGETLVIIGRSGCGKSVLLKHIMAILEPDEGDIKIDGRSMFSMLPDEQDQCRLQLGMLFQGAALFDSLTVLENVGFSLFEHTNLSENVISQRVLEKLRMVARLIERSSLARGRNLLVRGHHRARAWFAAGPGAPDR